MAKNQPMKGRDIIKFLTIFATSESTRIIIYL